MHAEDTTITLSDGGEDDPPVSDVWAIPVFVAAGASQGGRLRPSNEDAFCIEPRLGLFAVADGRGGDGAGVFGGGEVAARLAVQTVKRWISGNASATCREVPQSWRNHDADRLGRAFEHANLMVRRVASERPLHHGMTTTLVALVTRGPVVTFAHVGDSRLYRFRNGALTRLTADRTAHLGAERDTLPELGTDRPEPDDVYLLCTDGLWGAVEERWVAAAITERISLQHAADTLVALALLEGAPDDVTVVLVGPRPTSAPCFTCASLPHDSE